MVQSAQTLPLGEPTDRRQRRWLATHEKLYEAAAALFLEKGFVATTIDDIADEADVARKTAFNHFARKRDFIGEWGRRRRRYAEQLVLEADETPEVIRQYLIGLASAHQSDRAMTRRMLAGWRECGGPFDGDEHRLISVFRTLAQQGSEEGHLRADIDTSRIATLLYSGYFGILFEWGEGTDDNPPFDLTDALLHTLNIVLTGASR